MMCTMLVNMLTCKHVIQIATRRRLSIFSGGTDMLICRRVSFRSSSIISLSTKDSLGDHSMLKRDTFSFIFGWSAHSALRIDFF